MKMMNENIHRSIPSPTLTTLPIFWRNLPLPFMTLTRRNSRVILTSLYNLPILDILTKELALELLSGLS